jgi:hypothetical protein
MAYKVVNLDDNLLDFRRKYNVTSKFAGDSALLTTGVQSSLVGAINEIEAVFDASANQINSTGLLIDDTADITLDAAGDDIIFMDAGAERWRVNLDVSPSLEATGDASIIGSGNLTIDAVTDITLDADDGDIFLKDGGVQFGSLTNTSGNLIVKSGTTTAATFSGADVTFASDVTVTDNLTVNGNTTLGNAATDTVTITADVASNILPSADDTYDLGAVGSEWKDLYVDGTANIDSLVADTADINGGTIDGTTIGGSSAAAITGTTIDGTTITATTSLVSPQITRTGDFTVDASGDIVLDADGADVLLKDAGVQYGALTNTSGNLIVKSGATTAATFSGANVTFAGTITQGTALTTTATTVGAAINELKAAVDVADGTATSSSGFIGDPSSLDSDEFSYATKAGGRFNVVEMMSELGRRMVDVYDSAGTLLNVATP